VKTVVLKFGGASLESVSHIERAAEIIIEQKKEFDRVVAIVSAMGKTTNSLIGLATSISPMPPQREYDMLITAGERISMALLAMALHKKSCPARSFTGSQAGIITSCHHTEAKIIDVRPFRIEETLRDNHVAIIAGFQGVSLHKEITTLGRGGSDTTAVALGVALESTKVAFYKDVSGMYDEDPKINPSARFFPSLSYDEAISITEKGAKVLHTRSLFLAAKNNMPLHVRSFEEHTPSQGTLIQKTPVLRKQKLYEI